MAPPTYVSTSAAPEPRSTIDSFLPVSLPREREMEFRTYFHPRRRKKLNIPRLYVDFLTMIASTNLALNCLTSVLRDAILYESNGRFDWSDKAAVSEQLNTLLAQNYSTYPDLENQVKRFITVMSGGSQHVIQDSIRFKGGQDVLFLGQRGPSHSSLMLLQPTTISKLPVMAAGASEILAAATDTDFAKAVVATLKKVQALFLKGDIHSAESAHLRLHYALSVRNFNHILKDVQKVLDASPLARDWGVVLQLPEVTPLDEVAVNFFDKYNQVLVVREPDSDVVRAKMKAALQDRPDSDVQILQPQMVVETRLSFSFALGLPKDFVDYICQDADKVSYASLSTWLGPWLTAHMRPPGLRGQGLYPSRIPRYVMLPSRASELAATRKRLGLYNEPGRCNADGIYITSKGDIAYLPPQSEALDSNAKAYEALLEEAYRASFSVGSPLITTQAGASSDLYSLVEPGFDAKIADVKRKLNQFKGCVQAYSWDLNCVITTSATAADRLVSQRLVGAAKPTALNLAAYMRKPISASMVDMFSTSTVSLGNKRVQVGPGDFALALSGSYQDMMDCSLFAALAAAYNMMFLAKKVPDLGELISRASKALGVSSLSDEKVAPFELSRDPKVSIYGDRLKPDLTYELLPATVDYPAGTKLVGQTILHLLVSSLQNASPERRGTVSIYCALHNIDPSETGRDFSPTSPMHEIDRVYTFFGGQVFLQALKAMLAVSFADWAKVGEHTDPNSRSTFVAFSRVQSEVLPFCTMFGKYATDLKAAIFKEADETLEANLHPKASEEELNIAGSRAPTANRPGMQLFPHQAEALTRLKNHPKIAILDISPGGGKTTLGIADIAMTYADGLIKRPFIICPPGLVATWVEDFHKHMEGRWNVIPITTETYGMWGDERLTEMIKKAPGNTAVIVGNSFLSNRGKVQLILGNSVETVSDSLEFCKKFEPDYIFVDESHRMRNLSSSIHTYVKALMQMSSLKFGRIGTGTFIQNVLSDAAGQSALFNAQIFRTREDFDATYKEAMATIGGEMVVDYSPEAPGAVRRHLAEFATLITYKRKEWAFMLPTPIETLIPVQFQSDVDDELGRKHRMFYDAVLKKTLEELRADKNVQALLKAPDEELGEEDGDGDDEARAKPKGATITINGVNIEVTASEDDSDNLEALEQTLAPRLERLERILTDPFGDPNLVEIQALFFSEEEMATFVPAKVKATIERIEKHFTRNPWKKGETYKSSDLVDIGDETYILRPDEPIGKTSLRADVSPDNDPDNWLKQTRGKVLVFCRYIRTVEAIMKALPAALRKRAVAFHGEVGDNKWENLNRFKEDPSIDILVANEMGISEGHNLQMASRFIRVETPWAPGELDQSSSRIFRPDVAGKYTRQVIYMDWLICDNTMEVAKLGRLVSKMLRKTQFDEMDNPTYFKGLNPLNLPIIKMSLDNLREVNRLSDLCAIGGEGDTANVHEHSYIGQYRFMVYEQSREFAQMKKTRRAHMIDVAPTPMPKGSGTIEFTPWVPNMKVPDRHDEGLVPLKAELLENTPLAVAVRKDPKALIGQYVRTEFGLGTIRRVSSTRGVDDSGEDADAVVTKVWVDLAQGGSVDCVSVSKVFLAKKVTERTKNARNAQAPKITEDDKKRTSGRRTRAEAAIQRAEQKRPIKPEAVTRAPRRQPEQEAPAPKQKIDVSLYAVVYNGYLALEAVPEDESVSLKRVGFARFGNYAWLPLKTYPNFTKVLDWLEAKYTIDTKTWKLLDSLHDSFQSGRGRKFDVELAPISTFPQFYRLRHRLTEVRNKRQPELKIYPVIINGGLVLTVDIATNPVIRKVIGKVIPGTSPGVKFQEADGLDIAFFDSKSQLAAKVKELRQSGYNVLNIEELKEEVKALDLKMATTSRK